MMKIYTQVLILCMVHSFMLQAANQYVINDQLRNAICGHNEQMVATLLSGPNVSSNFVSFALGAMPAPRNAVIANMLSKFLADAQKRNNLNQDLWKAVRVGDAVGVAYWVGLGADVHAANDQDSCTPLHAAIQLGHANVVQKLLDLGANKNARCEFPFNRTLLRCSPVHTAIRHRSHASLQILINEGSDIDAIDSWGNGVVHTAVDTLDITMVQAVLHAGAYVCPKNLKGDTPLHSAIKHESGQRSIVGLLARHDKITDGDRKNCTALANSSDFKPDVMPLLLISIAGSELSGAIVAASGPRYITPYEITD